MTDAGLSRSLKLPHATALVVGTILGSAVFVQASELTEHVPRIWAVLLAWTVSAVIRIAQGSATVAMITTSSMIYPMLTAHTLPYHPIYIFLAIGFGSKMLSWMNDSGFWTISKLSGFTEKETLQSWSLIVSTISFTGLLLTLIGATLLPFRP